MKETMTSRDRVLKAVRREIPDRVPIDLGGNQTGIHRVAYAALVRHLGIRDDVVILDAVQQLARPCEAVLERLRVDTRYIFAGAARDWKGGIVKRQRNGRTWHDLTDEFGVTWSMADDGGLFMDISHHPLADATLSDIANYPFPRGDDPGRFGGLREKAARIRKETPYAVVSGISGVVYEICWYLRGLEQWFIDMRTQPEFCEALLDQTLKFWLDWFRAFFDEVGELVDVIMIGDDLAAQHGPLFDPRFYRRIVQPRHRRLIQYIRSRTRAAIWYHTCGSCIDFVPDLIENGINVLNPVQTSAARMDPRVLKERFGRKIAFWGGGCDTQHVLPFGTPAAVAAHVRKNVEIFKEGGGYVFNNVHNIQADIPPENVLAMFDAAYEAGAY
jgi:uroporphyrinogen decarboxylase